VSSAALLLRYVRIAVASTHPATTFGDERGFTASTADRCIAGVLSVEPDVRLPISESAGGELKRHADPACEITTAGDTTRLRASSEQFLHASFAMPVSLGNRPGSLHEMVATAVDWITLAWIAGRSSGRPPRRIRGGRWEGRRLRPSLEAGNIEQGRQAATILSTCRDESFIENAWRRRRTLRRKSDHVRSNAATKMPDGWEGYDLAGLLGVQRTPSMDTTTQLVEKEKNPASAETLTG
jgi:hypothetical protein